MTNQNDNQYGETITLIGEFSGAVMKPWKDNEEKHDLVVGVKVNEKQDDYGNVSPVILDVIVQFDDHQKVQSVSNALKGKVIKMELIHKAMPGSNGAWIKRILRKGYDIKVWGE